MMKFVERAASLWLLWSEHRILDEDSRNRTDGCSYSGAPVCFKPVPQLEAVE